MNYFRQHLVTSQRASPLLNTLTTKYVYFPLFLQFHYLFTMSMRIGPFKDTPTLQV